jgi:N-acetylglucosamine-6-phosphate deacetylase
MVGLAGSALCLDAAVRNLVGLGIAAGEEAIAAASDNPARLLAPALAAHSIALTAGEVTWSEDLQVRAVRLGRIERRYDT